MKKVKIVAKRCLINMLTPMIGNSLLKVTWRGVRVKLVFKTSLVTSSIKENNLFKYFNSALKNMKSFSCSFLYFDTG